ncbi:MAG: molybdenum cofactor biosysynthesis protein [Jatrophihabitans sp.]|uniref:molybdenum cofactor biosysynthesis protein n=1 Tax=Jatrophihabitans sp. TaxID=1932789 RepID=UPI003F80DF66
MTGVVERVDGVEIVELLVSGLHRFEGRPSDGAAPEPSGELVASAEVRAGLGLVGDRYFGRRAHRLASVTLIAAESLPPGVGLRETRRNVLLRGLPVDDLLGATVSLGGVVVKVHRRANPCAWMDVTIGPGAMKALRGRGGVRCEPLTAGVLRVGPVDVTVSRFG